MGQGHALDGDVAPVFFRGKLDVMVTTKRPKRLNLEQRDLPSSFGFVRIESGLKSEAVAITLDAPPSVRVISSMEHIGKKAREVR